LAGIAQPPKDWKSALDAFENVYNHELEVSRRINDLVAAAQTDKDHAASAFLQWFVTEQVEEEKQADEVVQRLRMVANHAPGLMMLDQVMGRRGAE
jgi:ferritin